MYKCLMLSVFCILSMLTSQATAQQKPTISVASSIRPVDFLVRQIMTDVASPLLIIETGHSPHHFQLKPSQRKRIAEADLVFFISEGLESFLRTDTDPGKYISLINTPGLMLLENAFPNEKQRDHSHSGHAELIDPHIWLSPANTLILIEEITRKLGEKDPENQAIYARNAQILTGQIERIARQTQDSLQALAPLPFVVEHPAYNYFEQAFHIKNVGHVSPSEELPASVRHIKDLQDQIQKTKAACLLYDKSKPSQISQQLSERYHMKMVSADPLGRMINPGPDYYAELMQNLTHALQLCKAPHN